MTDGTGKQGGDAAQGTNAQGADTRGTDTPGPEELARRLLDLWQDQIGAMAANPDIAAQAARLMAALPLPGMWLSQMGQMGMGQMGMGQMGAGHEQMGGDLAQAWIKMSQNWASQDWWKGTSDASPERPTERAAQPAASKPSAPAAAPGAATAASASEPRGNDLDELRLRLAGIERRLGELAEQSGGKRKPAAGGKSAKPRSAPK